MTLDRDTLLAAMREIDAMIVQGNLGGNGCDKNAERNGIVLAYNRLYALAQQAAAERCQSAVPHTDHPLRHWDRTCPACIAESVVSEQNMVVCLDCGKPYRDFPLDTTLPDAQWQMINDGERGILCANCIVARAAKLPGAVAARMRIEFATEDGSDTIMAADSGKEVTK